MTYRRILLLACAAIFLLLPATSTAAARPWLSGWFGGSIYAMGDINYNIGVINDALAGSGLEMEEINRGLQYGGALGLDLGTSFSVGVGYDRLTGQSDVGNQFFSIEYDIPAYLLRGFGRYSFESTGKTKGFLEASLGRVTCDGNATTTVSVVGPATATLDGSGLAAEGAGGFSYWTNPRVAVVGVLGYRFANVEDVEANGAPSSDPNGDPYSIDYSGVFVRLGLTLALAP